MKQYIVTALAGMVTAGGLITAAPPASAGCINPDWAGHPLAQMCDDPVTSDGMWQRCVTYYPNGVRDLDERHEGDGRFVWMEHAERNAIFEAAKLGTATKAATLATTFFPCIDCARAIVQAGIARLCTPAPDYADAVWGQSFLRSRVILEEGGVVMHFVDADGAADNTA